VQRPETKARARALQILYAWDLSGRPSIETVVGRLAAAYGHPPEGYDRGADLAAQAIAGLPEFDTRVGDAAEHWRLEIAAFFNTYKMLDGDNPEIKGWRGTAAAWKEIESAQRAFKNKKKKSR